MTRPVWRIGTVRALQLNQLAYGSTLAVGRWHLSAPEGQSVVYAASTRSLCQLEKRVHANGKRPIDLALLRLDFPDDALLQNVRELTALPPDWTSREALTQAVGVRWRRSGRALGLWVPSAIEPGDNNLLINPDHSDFARIAFTVERNPFEFDARLF